MGTWRNRKSENVDVRAGATIGIAGAATAVVGAVIAEALPERVAAVSFAVLMLAVCTRLALAMRRKTS
jgi:uncharacterized membrane protein YfcA